MREAHAHILQLGRSLSMCDLSSCTSAEDALETLAAFAQSLPENAWVLAHSARPESWDPAIWMSRTALDAAIDERPACVWCFDYHALVASSAAMEIAGINADTPFENGSVELDDSGAPSGLLLEHAALALWERVPEPDERERVGLVKAACKHLASLGFKEVHDLKAQPWLGDVLSTLIELDEIDQRFSLYPLMQDLDACVDRHGGWHQSVSLSGGKVFTDGTLNSRTAWVLHPWADAPTNRPNGIAMMRTPEIIEAIEHAASHGLPIAAHAIGDGAVRAVLDAIEQTSGLTETIGGSHRIEHAELIDADDVPRFAQLGAIASLQPCHLLADIEALGRACPDRIDRVLPIRELIDSGLVPGESLYFGSDVPIVRADHTDSVQASVYRRRAGDAATDAISPEHAITETEALACFAIQD